MGKRSPESERSTAKWRKLCLRGTAGRRADGRGTSVSLGRSSGDTIRGSGRGPNGGTFEIRRVGRQAQLANRAGVNFLLAMKVTWGHSRHRHGRKSEDDKQCENGTQLSMLHAAHP